MLTSYMFVDSFLVMFLYCGNMCFLQGLQHTICGAPTTTVRGLIGTLLWISGLLINIDADLRLHRLKTAKTQAGIRLILTGTFASGRIN